MKGIIIAAGMGKRMGAYTAEIPKCQLEVAGTTLLENIINRFNSLGVEDIAVVTGYREDKIKLPGVTYFRNENFENNNILHSLICARDFFDDDLIISYSDIWLDEEPVIQVLNNPGDLVLAVDTDWLPYYEGRTEHPVSEAENVFVDESSLATRIGKHLDPRGAAESEVCGEFIGLIKLSADGAKTFLSVFDDIEQNLSAQDPFQNSKSWHGAYLTDFFSELITRGYDVHCALHRQGWAEIDTAQDYERLLEKTGQLEKQYRKSLGAMILSEANDLKRTVRALADDLEMDYEKVQSALAGEGPIETLFDITRKMGEVYPIDSSNLMLPMDDCSNGVRILRQQQSAKSSRVFERASSAGGKTPYYEYRDTAMSNMAPFRPEWIKELRHVSDCDPENPDVVYNNGHFMHQITFFIGPVNFYWEVDGKKYCQEMNTGDSNYITPFWPHSFASRDESEEAVIIAVTFGGEVRRSQKEIYRLGQRTNGYIHDSRNVEKGYVQIIQSLVENELLSMENITDRLEASSINKELAEVIAGKRSPEVAELFQLAEILEIDPSEFILPRYEPGHEVIVKKRTEAESYFYPGKDDSCYRVFPAVRTPKMSGLKGFELEVLEGTAPGLNMQTGLHSYLHNFGDQKVEFIWNDGQAERQSTLYPGDSAYIQPFVSHGFGATGDTGRLFLVRIRGAMNIATRKELSSFASTDRAIEESMCWFD